MKRDSLAKNTVMLYLLTGSNYLLAFILVPYLTRVLGAEVYGTIGFATSTANIVSTIVAFGFMLSATLDIARHQDDLEAVSRIMTTVTIAKLLLAAGSLVVVLVLVMLVDQFKDQSILIVLYVLFDIVTVLMPDFVYRGLESMQTITIRSVAIKTFAALGIVAFVKGPQDCNLVPFFYFVGSLAALGFVYLHMHNKMGIWFVRIGPIDVIDQLRNSAAFFISRIAATVFSSLNMILLGLFFPGAALVGHYSACNSIIRAGRNVIMPVTSSLFPHIVRTKNFKLVKKVLLIGEAILIAGCLVIGVFAEPVCILFFGPEYADAASILTLLLPLIPIALASYLLGWSVLGALELENVTNRSVYIGSAIHAGQLLLLCISGSFNVYTLCIATVITEAVILLIRIVAALPGLRNASFRQVK